MKTQYQLHLIRNRVNRLRRRISANRLSRSNTIDASAQGTLDALHVGLVNRLTAAIAVADAENA